nr:hypothetical protein [Bacillota bacterium]
MRQGFESPWGYQRRPAHEVGLFFCAFPVANSGLFAASAAPQQRSSPDAWNVAARPVIGMERKPPGQAAAGGARHRRLLRPLGRGSGMTLMQVFSARRVAMALAAAAMLAAAWFAPELVLRRRAETFQAELSGFQEVPPILTAGTGTFRAELARDGQSIGFELAFSGLRAPVTVAHLHFGQPGVNGGVFAFLCGGGGKPACPQQGGSVQGTISPADIVAVPEQGLAAGDWEGALRILRAGAAYANVHSTQFPAGEIRGQVRGR